MKILQNESLRKYTTFKIGGPALTLVVPESYPDLINFLRDHPLDPATVILGEGSNVLISDNGINSTVLKISFGQIEFIPDSNMVKVGAGVKLSNLAKTLSAKALTGLEFVFGIPGTVGGAIVMNAGLKDQWISQALTRVFCVDFSGKEIVINQAAAGFGYRRSRFQTEKLIITAAEFALEKDNSGKIKKRMENFKIKRSETQPLALPSAGSIFKNPAQGPAAMLIEACGLKGAKIGGAAVSEQHANFIINQKEATAQDVLQLIDLIQRKVFDKFQVKLELEIRVII
ncbi:MAG: UDP-N-acetylmuramate dehydrogenase [Candidatus Margulisbacteria bacterium]|nr:UDP-N-acetylmuramate dehydrogenase [Candidatus Margulisiibacteriota bacterium]MBU1022568.1 UDP-N-acetylmuramate dehydrogenase [Candidatus Margulisiibacteriota bacterium]MBU1728854.1 UDP-N-acetylmuramate dehydrogenase [Candidatus Margulisiibacteriota bacterium]MBU1955485.1 UDP-N-acetylmuramate dehydrogenase [Candidatus Margulisiibacteriota bacterium]